MKELHFERVAASGMMVADEGRYRFGLVRFHVGAKTDHWKALVFDRHSVRVSPIAEQHCRTRAVAIDWLARFRVPEKEETGT